MKGNAKQIGRSIKGLFHPKEKEQRKVQIELINYSEKSYTEKILKNVEECFSAKNKETTTWINVDGIHQKDIISKIGKHFQLHPLTIEDITETTQRPKIEYFEDYIFVIIKILNYDEKSEMIGVEQFSLILGKNQVITFQENPRGILDNVKEWIKTKKPIRNKKADYLAYAIIDAVSNSYFEVLERIGERINYLEEEIITNPSKKILGLLHNLKKEMILLEKVLWPLREVIRGFEIADQKLVNKETILYFRDVYDDIIQIIDLFETLREFLTAMLDIYLSSVSNKLNEVMKVLTIYASIFIPLTFVVGIYGMNFKFMPELEWKYGYFVVLGIMALIGAGMVAFFKKERYF